MRGLGDFMARPKAKDKPKAKTHTLTIRLSEETIVSLRARAENENRSLGNLCSTYIESVVSFGTSELKQKLSSNGRRKTRPKSKR